MLNRTIMTALLVGTAATGCTDDATPSRVYATMVRGRLASSDLATAQAAHDMIATAGEPRARAKGDLSHDVLLGTTLLDSTQDEFFAFDRWNDDAAMKAFYADPSIAQGFASLFAEPPTVEYFVYEPDWVGWGDITSGDSATPHYFHLALGDLANADSATNKASHDQVASGGKDPSLAAGNVAHLIYLGEANEQRFLGLDIWGSDTNIEAFYTNPQFVSGFAPLFRDVTQPVYASTSWHQW